MRHEWTITYSCSCQEDHEALLLYTLTDSKEGVICKACGNYIPLYEIGERYETEEQLSLEYVNNMLPALGITEKVVSYDVTAGGEARKEQFIEVMFARTCLYTNPKLGEFNPCIAIETESGIFLTSLQNKTWKWIPREERTLKSLIDWLTK